MAAPEQSAQSRPDVGDPEHVGQRKRDANAREARRLMAFHNFLKTPDGRDWAWAKLEECYIFRTTYTGNAQSYFNEGMRNVGLMILADIVKQPDLFTLMMKEHGK